jgi:proteasome accessory factor B
MSRRRIERLLNLTMCLMATSRFLSVDEIGRLVEGYEPDGTPEQEAAFRRMFERDKENLRELGIPLEVGTNPLADGEAAGYRIRRDHYELPDIRLEPDEAAALGLAARLWSSARFAGASANALRKLAAGGTEIRPVPAGFEPRVDATEPALLPCLDAVRLRRAVRFPYRKVEQDAAADRRVQPWGVVSWRGRWYLAGYDLDRGAGRCFRLSRITGKVDAIGPAAAYTIPDGVDLRGMVTSTEPPVSPSTARLRVRPGTGHTLRRAATRTMPAAGGAPAGDVLDIHYYDLERLARWVVGHGADVVVLGPPELRDEVTRRLRATAAAHGGARDAATVPTLAGDRP